MNKKLLSLLLAIAMVFSFIPAAFAEGEDVKTEEKAVEEAEKVDEAVQAETTPEFIKFLMDNGYVKGDAKGDLMLDKNLTRAEFTALLTRLDGQEATATAVKALPSKFTDLTPAHWANGYVNVATDKAWVKGYPDGTFKPEGDITYAEVATVLVRYTGVDTTGFIYPTGYIAAAFEKGIFEDVENVQDYKTASVRKNVFQMLYNVISDRDFGKFNVYKGIVIENNRTANIGKDEIKMEVIDIVQESNQVDASRAKKGQQIVFDLKDTKYDSENLIGKVADFTVDGNKLVKIKVDDSYKYEKGEIYWGVTNDKKFNNVGVRVDERYFNNRYDQQDNRMFRTYVTNGFRAENYHYVDFVKLPESRRPNYARYTVKDGRVIFVDAYRYKDIAPVQEVKRDGSDVYYYDDARNGSLDRMTPERRVIGYTDEKGFYNMDKKDIKADDVIHWMDGFTLVRQDALLRDKLVKTYIDRDGEFAVIGEDPYYLRTDKFEEAPFNSVYAYDIKQFRTLHSRSLLNGMIDAEVKVLLDVFGDVQYITSDAKFTDNVGLVERFIQPHMRFNAANGQDKYELDATLDTDYYFNKSWNTSQAVEFDKYRRFDIVYTAEEKDGKAALIAGLMPFANYKGYLDKTSVFKQPAKFEEKYNRYLEVTEAAGKVDYRFDQNTYVFAINGAHDDPYFVKTTMEDIMKYNQKNKDLTAYVINEKDFGKFVHETLGQNRYYDYGTRTDFAKIIVFGNVDGESADLMRPELGRVVRVYNYSSAVDVEVTRGNVETFKIVGGKLWNKKVLDAKIGDLVEFQRVKDSKDNEAVFNLVMEPEYYGPFDHVAFDKLVINEDKHFIIDRNTKEFGDNRERFVAVYGVGRYADVIIYSSNPNPTPNIIVKTVTFISDDMSQIALDKEIYRANKNTVVYNAEGKIIALGNFKGLVVGDKVTVDGDVFKVVKVTAPEEPKIVKIAELNNIEVTVGEEVNLPKMVKVTYSDKTIKEVAVKWNLEGKNFGVAGTYDVEGTVEGTDLKAMVKVIVKPIPEPELKVNVAFEHKKFVMKVTVTVEGNDQIKKFKVLPEGTEAADVPFTNLGQAFSMINKDAGTKLVIMLYDGNNQLVTKVEKEVR